MTHQSVLLQESIDALSIRKGGIYVDCTLGGGGHSLEILKVLGPEGKLIAIDQDEFAHSQGRQRLEGYGNVIFVQDNFGNLKSILGGLGIKHVDGILLDLGVSSFQFDDLKRGFSYWDEADLDMRMDPKQSLDAKEIVNTYSLTGLTTLFRDYGEEPNAYRIAKRICLVRESHRIETTSELVEIIRSVLSEKEKRKPGHPSRRVFQALRIEVNHELEMLERVLPAATEALGVGGRLAVITFHSLEDRIVKRFIREQENPCICPKSFPVCTCGRVRQVKNITRKPIVPSEDELNANTRSRSAKLRIAEKV